MKTARMKTLRQYEVEVYDAQSDDFDEVGSVLLPPFATDSSVARALAACGVYAPRGLDELHWGIGDFAALIWDGEGQLIVRLRYPEPVTP